MFEIQTQIEYEELLSILRNTHKIPKYGAAYIQFLEIKEAVEKWEREHEKLRS